MAKSTKKKKNPKNVRAGRKARAKGGVFERKISKIVREHWPNTEIRRSKQSERAYDSDIVVLNGPTILKKIWWECNDSAKPQPAKKLEQAEKDTGEFLARIGEIRFPVVIWHKIRSPRIFVRMTVETLCLLQCLYCEHQEQLDMEFQDFISLLKKAEEDDNKN